MTSNRVCVQVAGIILLSLFWLGCSGDDGGSDPSQEIEGTEASEGDADTAEQDAVESTPDATEVEEDVSTGPDFNDCEKTVSATEDCNPYCQLGCPDNQQCTFKSGQLGCTVYNEKQHGETCS